LQRSRPRPQTPERTIPTTDREIERNSQFFAFSAGC
jgi:hypothetical protein